MISVAGCLNKHCFGFSVTRYSGIRVLTRNTRYVRGYSLLELMIVMVVIGVVTSIAALSFSNFGAGVGEKTLERLRYDVQLLSNESIVRSEILALGFHNNGYAFMRLDEENSSWNVIEKDRFLKPRKFEASLNIRLVVDDAPLTLGDSLGLEPQIISMPTGEVTPFIYQLESVAEDYRDQLKFDALGRVVKDEEQENDETSS